MSVQHGGKSLRDTNQSILLPDPATELRDNQELGLGTVKVKGDARFP